MARVLAWVQRESLLAAAVVSLPLLFALDFATSAYFVPNFFVVPLIASAALGRPRMTGALTAAAIPLVILALAHEEGFSGVAVARVTLIAASGLTATWVAGIVARSRARLQAAERQMRLLAENASDIVFRDTKEGVLEWISPSVERELGYRPQEMVGRPIGSFAHPEDVAGILASSSDLNRQHPVSYRARFQRADGDLTWLEVNARPVLEGQCMVGRIGSARRVDGQVALEEELHRRATTDDLTGATRRDEALRHLESLQRTQQRTGHESAVLFCDIDHFKCINDTYGHGAGDEVLRQLAERLRSRLRDEDSVARFGGDEFVVVLHSIHSLEDAQRIALKLHRATYLPIHLPDGRDVSATLSMGLTPIRPGESVTEVLERADRALYEAKEAGRDRVICHA